MVLAAISNLKERSGSSRQAISKYINENYEVPPRFEVHMKQALKRLVGLNTLIQTRGTGASGSFMVNKGTAKESKSSDKESVKRPAKTGRTRVATKVKIDSGVLSDDSDENKGAAKATKSKPVRGPPKKRGVPSDEDAVSEEVVKRPQGGKGKPRKGVAKGTKKGGASLDSAGEDSGDEVAEDTKLKPGKGKRATKSTKKDAIEKTTEQKGGRARGRRAVSVKNGGAEIDISDGEVRDETTTKPKGVKGKAGKAKSANKGSADAEVVRGKGKVAKVVAKEDLSDEETASDEEGEESNGEDKKKETPEGMSPEDPSEGTDEEGDDKDEMKKAVGKTKRAGVKNAGKLPAKKPKK